MRSGKSDYKIIRVTPTLDTSAYAVDDVLFTGVEIPNAVIGLGGCSKLLNMYVLDQQDTTDVDIEFYFTEKNTAIGTQNASATITDANMEAIGFCCAVRLDTDQSSSGNNIDNSRVHEIVRLDGANIQNTPIALLQAENDSTSVYVHAIVTAGTPTFAADDLDLIFHLER
tara:strand:- start:60 stop:569 length:510 start_codon:yes stop_codon:yes gene_type:complete